jgi:ABC-type uncharacterized transport system permease subunit
MTVGWRRIVLAVAAPTVALAFALLVTALVLVSTGDPVWSTATSVWDYGTTPRVIALTFNQGTIYYLSALAVAIGFRMNLFNIGVDGQYQIAAFFAAVVGGWLLLPGPVLIIVVAIACGIAYWVLLGRTRFGFDLRATGRSESAAVASGVHVKRMVVISLLISGAVAGLVGMPQLLGGDTRSYSLDFPAGLGFTGIAIALLGRNNAIGMALAALLFSFLDSSSIILDINGISKEIVLIMQGTIVLSVVIVY